MVSEQMNRNIWYRTDLVPAALLMLEGVVPRLQEGGTVADVGCGTGSALFAMAEAFPRSDFHGYEVSRLTLERAEVRRRRANLGNVSFHDVREEQIPLDARFDLILTFDCLHDLPNPEAVIGEIRGALKPDGVWFIEDVDAEPTFEDELRRDRRRAAGLYALSMAAGCLASSLSEPDGAGLGTLGLPETRLRQLVQHAGFGTFRRLELRRQSAAFFEVRI
jgi:SAM-dependent methyltransferase